ncbi:hypothetical protein ACLMJK_009420 [Lecanora helva]
MPELQLPECSSVATVNITPATSRQLDNESEPTIASKTPSRWWEDEANEILLRHDFQDVKLACRFRTYSDENLLRDILRRRWALWLNAVFLSVHGVDRETVDNLNKDQKVGGILEKLVPPLAYPAPSDIQESQQLLPKDDVSQRETQIYPQQIYFRGGQAR